MAAPTNPVDINALNCAFYNDPKNTSTFDVIPFKDILIALFNQYGKGTEILEVGSGPGAFAAWLAEKGHNVTCLEPARELAKLAAAKGLKVHEVTIQAFNTDAKYDSVVAISSLIHVPKQDLAAQIEKIARLLKPQGMFFVSFIEGNSEGLEDPTSKGKDRFFSRWSEAELNSILSPYFKMHAHLEIPNPKMNCMFFLRVYSLKKEE